VIHIVVVLLPSWILNTDPTSVAEIALHLPDTSPGLAAGLVSSSSKATTMSLVRDYLGLLSAADNPTPAGRAGTFLSFGGSKAQVEFELLARALQLRVMDGIARERHGDAGVRIMRLLRGLGKTAEQQIGKVGMMASKEVRPLLSAMAADGLVSMQEVPKSADRNPSRTFYLWYIDPKKSAAVVLGQLYKMLYNIGKRRAAEGEDPLVKAVIEKRARSDVEQDEGLLTRNERELIQDWEGRCERLTVVEMRVEEAVFVLRDMAALISHEK
jgi:DNA-directed RNA polymerase III subunit RPC3